ncbi:UDP-glucose 4-epimerase [Epithele typhae]|uniref:UDP-glucose 4-epimerase n=1 Tax=Epithele typhae TaxID=378194 RepID=UPI0020085AF4|nr:UDP-glucose 4-epimerase [Epithele typhae]KAH9923139.1 UDP-glucose 4-epimerase [Epithele typhae]
MQAVQQSLKSLVSSLPSRTADQSLDTLVQEALLQTKAKVNPDHFKNQWEFALRKEIFDLASTEGKALKDSSTTYYDQLRERLELVLAATEQEACEATFPFMVLQDLLETQTIASCSHIFSWIEAHADRLTVGMVPQKGKALVLLRMLNDLLRRLSNTGATTMFCGRILAFLSRVFPLGERSGVNLRGEYGPTWDGPAATAVERKAEEESKMDVDESKEEQAASAAEKRRKEKEELYLTFWSLQLPFSKPAHFVDPKAFPAFKEAVGKVLPVIKDANAKERALMGSKSKDASPNSNLLKRKRDAGVNESASSSEYYFAKYLTSPELLDLEIADAHFRRQFLFQLLILLHFLLTYTKEAKVAWATPRNRSLHLDFVIQPEDAQWVQDTITRATEELRQTAPNGRMFSDTVQVILEREKNWTRWKNEMCTPFDREPWAEEVEVDGGKAKVGLDEATAGLRKKMRMDPDDWPHRYGSAPLTEIWEMGYRDLFDLEHPFHPGDVKDFVRKIKQDDARINMRRNQLLKQAERVAAARAKAAAEKEAGAKAAAAAASPAVNGAAPADPSVAAPGAENSAPASTPAPAPAPAAPIVLPPDSQITKLEDVRIVILILPCIPRADDLSQNKTRTTWLALRTAREQHLTLFGKIGTGDVILLEQEIEREEREKAAAAQAAAQAATQAHCAQRVLVTGGAGYIASHVIFCLQQTRRYKVISIDNHHNSSPKALERVAELARETLPANASKADRDSAEVEAVTADLTRKDEIRKVFEKYGKGGIWGVIHIAAYKAVGESTEIPLTYYENNVSATIYLLQVMSEFDCTRIVYSSSATVYGTPPVIPIPETTRLEAHSPYGKTKVMCETIIQDLCAAEPKRWRGISLRYFNPGGAHPSGHIGEAPIGRPGNLFPLLAAIAVGRQPNDLKVFGNDYPTPDGTCVRDYLHILDLAKGHLLALDALVPESKAFDDCPADARYKAYNLGRGRGMSVMQILEAMRKCTGFDYKYEIVGRRYGDVPDLTADPSLAEKQLGFKADQDLETMCRDLWNWQTKNPKGYE